MINKNFLFWIIPIITYLWILDAREKKIISYYHKSYLFIKMINKKKEKKERFTYGSYLLKKTYDRFLNIYYSKL